MKQSAAVDQINRRTMSASVAEYAAIVHEGLNAQERAALADVIDAVKDRRILDLGVGAGRTVTELLAVSSNYIGVDYMQGMVEHCSAKFPGARFEQTDARAMSGFADGAFDLVFFSCNGISMVDHQGRMAILREVHRVLAPRGVFIFSTCNRNSAEYEAAFRLPALSWTGNPLRLAVRSVRLVWQLGCRIVNRLRNLRHEVRTEQYAIVNDVCHHYSTMLYFITVAQQREQLARAGFQPDAAVYDLSGVRGADDTRDGTVAFVAGKA